MPVLGGCASKLLSVYYQNKFESSCKQNTDHVRKWLRELDMMHLCSIDR